MGGCDFILRGHQHEPTGIFDSWNPYGDSVVIPAGACYDRRIPADPRYANAYNFVHFGLGEWAGNLFSCAAGTGGINGEKMSIPLHLAGKFEFNIYESVPQESSTR